VELTFHEQQRESVRVHTLRGPGHHRDLLCLVLDRESSDPERSLVAWRERRLVGPVDSMGANFLRVPVPQNEGQAGGNVLDKIVADDAAVAAERCWKIGAGFGKMRTSAVLQSVANAEMEVGWRRLQDRVEGYLTLLCPRHKHPNL